MRINGARAHQAELVVHAQIAACLRKQFANPSNLVLVLGDMRLNPHVGILRGQLARSTQLRRTATGHKARRDGVTQPVDAVPALNQRFSVKQALLGVVTHTVGRVLVHQHLAGNQAQAVLLRLGKQRIDRFGMRSGKSQRRRYAVAQQLRYEKRSCLRTVVGRREPFFMRKGVIFQPRQQAIRR